MMRAAPSISADGVRGSSPARLSAGGPEISCAEAAGYIGELLRSGAISTASPITRRQWGGPQAGKRIPPP